MKTNTITRKIELRFNGADNDARTKFYSDLRRWQRICQDAANRMSSHLYMLLEEDNFVYMSELGKRKIFEKNLFADLPEKERKKLIKEENKEIYKVMGQEQKEFFEGSIANAYYRLLSYRHKGECPTGILSSLSFSLFKTFANDKKDLIKGTKSLRSYKADIPIPIPSSNILNVKKNVYQDKVTKDFEFTLYQNPLRTHFGKDLSNNHYLMSEAFSSYFLPAWTHAAESQLSDWILASENAGIEVIVNDRSWTIDKIPDSDIYRISTIDGDNTISFKMIEQKFTLKDSDGNNKLDEHGKKERGKRYVITDNIKLCDSSIQLKKEQVEGENGKQKYITRIFLLATLQIEKKKVVLDESKVAQVYLSPEVPLIVNIGGKIFKIGSKDDFLYRRTGIQGAFRQTQRDLRFEGGGKGRKRKMRGIDRYKNYEKDVVQNKIHNYTRKLIDFCLQFKCKYIYLLNVKRSKEEAKENPYILRNYSVGSFARFIEQKAAAIDIVVIEEGEKVQPEDEAEDI